MNPPSPASQNILSWLVSLLVPIALILGSVRVLLTPAFVHFEYNTPGFPEDPFGFTKQERVQYALIALDYLSNDAGISFLGDLRFPEGGSAPTLSCQYMQDCTRLYNDRELEHMVDVKRLVQASLRLWYFSLAVLMILGLWAWKGDWWETYGAGLARGGWLTTILLGAIILFVLFAFEPLFIMFHEVFFPAGTWTFFYSDTLIRLFPERFWQIAFIAIGVLSAGFGIAFGYFLGKK